METSEIWIGIIVPIFIGPICAYLMTLRNDYVERIYRRQREKYEEERDNIYDSLKNFYWPVYLNLLYIEQYSYQLPIKNKFRYESESSIEFSNCSNDYFDESKDINNNENINTSDTNTNNNNKSIEVDLDKFNIKSNIQNNDKETEIISDSSSDNVEICIDIPYNNDNKNEQQINFEKMRQRRESRKSGLKENQRKTIILDKKTLFIFENNLNKKYSELLKILEDNIITICIHQTLHMEIIKFMKYIKVREIIHEGSPDREYNIEYFGVENNIKTIIFIIKGILDELNTKYTILINNPV